MHKAHTAHIEWQRDGHGFTDHRYSRVHRWSFDGGLQVPASASPSIVRAPYSDPAGVDPEEGFVAALSSCHMLWFLDVAAREGLQIERYADRAEGYLETRPDGKQWLARVRLLPVVVVSGARPPDDALMQHLHHRAHEECFLANALKSEMTVEGSWTYAPG
jgi:organic hydroperoxide reductase OsmC/OhrA